MGMQESKEIWTRVDLFCDGLGDNETSCVEYVDANNVDANVPMVTDCCYLPEDARRLALNAATREGWLFEIRLTRWLCPSCVKVLQKAMT